MYLETDECSVMQENSLKRLVNEKNYQKMVRNRTGRKSAISLPLNTQVGRFPTRESVTSRNTSRKRLPTRLYAIGIMKNLILIIRLYYHITTHQIFSCYFL